MCPAKFVFANMVEADLRGADLRELSFGYASIDGTGDAHTQLHGHCKVDDAFAIVCLR